MMLMSFVQVEDITKQLVEGEADRKLVVALGGGLGSFTPEQNFTAGNIRKVNTVEDVVCSEMGQSIHQAKPNCPRATVGNMKMISQEQW